MMWKRRQLTACLFATLMISQLAASNANDDAANKYMDSIVGQVPQNLLKSGSIFLDLPNFQFAVADKETHVYFEGFFGRLDVSSASLKRDGDCSKHCANDENVVVSCLVSISGAKVLYRVASTFTYNEMYRHYQTYDIMVKITASKLTLETKQQRGSSNPPYVFLFTLDSIEFSEPILDYNRFHSTGLLMPEANRRFKVYVGDVITQGKYREAVDDVVAKTQLPLPSDMEQKKDICSIILNE